MPRRRSKKEEGGEGIGDRIVVGIVFFGFFLLVGSIIWGLLYLHQRRNILVQDPPPAPLIPFWVVLVGAAFMALLGVVFGTKKVFFWLDDR